MTTATIDPARTAVLVMDMQAPFLTHCAEPAALIERINTVIDPARDSGALIVFVRVGFRPGHPELSTRSPLSRIVSGDMLITGGADTEIDERLHHVPSDVLATKHRTSALFGNDLELILRSRDIDTLVLTGFSTGGVVLSTMDTAFELDYRLIVPADCCADPDKELHETLLAKLFPRKASVLESTELSWQARQ